jgi:hypothetical protein
LFEFPIGSNEELIIRSIRIRLIIKERAKYNKKTKIKIKLRAQHLFGDNLIESRTMIRLTDDKERKFSVQFLYMGACMDELH